MSWFSGRSLTDLVESILIYYINLLPVSLIGECFVRVKFLVSWVQISSR
uniref:Uncharacterized protein n=1 Tax=Arundo donax TaxID=35708 RepID=A0A0A9BAR7_ARUDO